MTATKPAIPPTVEAGLETVRVITETLRIVTDKRLELYNLTEKVADIVKRHDIKARAWSCSPRCTRRSRSS